MKVIILSAFLIIISFCAFSQNLIGLKGKEIKKYMMENRRDMNSEKVVNSKFNYLKFSNSSDSQTMLFFLDKDSVCKSVRIICDYGAKTERIKEFNSIYKRKSENKWVDNRNGKDYLIEVKDDKWSCTITIVPDK